MVGPPSEPVFLGWGSFSSNNINAARPLPCHPIDCISVSIPARLARSVPPTVLWIQPCG
jgi:hypothetical protein